MASLSIAYRRPAIVAMAISLPSEPVAAETDPAKLWRWYIQLTQAEAAFRTAKSDIGLRPVYHQKTRRVEAHLLVCFLSLALWRPLEMWMKAKGLGSSARKRVDAFSTIRSMDVTVPVKRQDRVLTLCLRTVAKPDPDVALLLGRFKNGCDRRGVAHGV